MAVAAPTPESLVSRRPQDVRRGDRVFRGMTLGAGLFILGLIVAIAVFLVWKAVPALRIAGFDFFKEKTWFPDAKPAKFGVAALAFGTVLSSVIALVLVVPVAIGAALTLTELAPRRLGTMGGYLVDVLAAVPSVVYGLWGIFVLAPLLRTWVQPALGKTLGFLPLFQGPPYGVGMLAAGIVLAIMVVPFITAVSREVLLAVPNSQREAALALGATRWETTRLAVHSSRDGASKASRLGCRKDRCQKV